MPVKLESSSTKSIYVLDMKDGQIAEIVSWSSSYKHIGRIVQRYKNNLICIGLQNESGWTDVFFAELPKECRVRILEKGEKIVIQ